MFSFMLLSEMTKHGESAHNRFSFYGTCRFFFFLFSICLSATAMCSFARFVDFCDLVLVDTVCIVRMPGLH